MAGVATNGLLQGRSALVTGGSGGIGAASATALAKDGAAVMIMGRNEDALVAAKERIMGTVPGAHIDLAVGDALSVDDMQLALSRARDLTGHLEILVPTVGGGGFGMLVTKSVEDFRADMDYNITTAFLAMRYGAPLMNAGGSIICISSTAATMPFPALASYCAAKAGLEALVRTAADEFAPMKIRVNAVRPGLTRSNATGDMFADQRVIDRFLEEIPLARTGEPHDIAAAVRYLAGPESSWVTGQSFAVDGGQELRKNPDLARGPS